MLEDGEISRIKDALAALRSEGDRLIPWSALPALSDVGLSGVALTIDLRATAALGAPLLVARTAHAPAAFWPSLSAREQEVARCIARGLSNKEIGRALHISTATVKDHVHHILRKASCASRGALAAKLNAAT